MVRSSSSYSPDFLYSLLFLSHYTRSPTWDCCTQMKRGWILLAVVVHITFATAQKCNLTYIDEVSLLSPCLAQDVDIKQDGYFPLAVQEIPQEKCPQSNDCCWCGFGNATSAEAWCCLTIACNAEGNKPFEEFAQSVCNANVGITNPGKMMTSCPTQGALHSSLKLVTSITAESISPSSTTRGLLPTSRIEDVETKSSQFPDTSNADQRKIAIAVSASLVGSVILALLGLYLWRRRQARRTMFQDLYSKACELPTESNTHEIDGRAMSIKQSKPYEIMSRSVERIPPSAKIIPPKLMPSSLAPLSTAKIWEQQNTTTSTQAEIRRLAERSPGSCQSLLLNRSPDGWTPCTPSDRSSSFALSIKPLPPPPPGSGFAKGLQKGGRYSDLQKALPAIGPSQR